MILEDSIQLQSPEAIALDGLIHDLELKERSYYRLSEHYFNIMQGDESPIKCGKAYAEVAFGIYANKSQEMKELINKWKPNKK